MTDDGWTEDRPWIGQYILDDDDSPVPAPGLLIWGRWLEDHPEKTQLAFALIGKARVSTIFLALDHGSRFLPQAGETFDPATYKPVLWETVVINSPGTYQTRYTSREDALEGHRKYVQMLTS